MRVIALLLLALTSCGSFYAKAEPRTGHGRGPVLQDIPVVGGMVSGETTANSSASTGKEVSTTIAEVEPQKRYIIYNAELRMNVSSPSARVEEAIAIAQEMGGYMKAKENFAVTVRVPADKMNEFIGRVKEFGTVVNQTVKGNDVTEEYLDLEIRLKNHEQALERLREILKQAKEVKDVLEIEKEIQRVTEEIERLKGRIKFLSDAVALATVTIYFNSTQSTYGPSKPTTPFYWVRQLGIEEILR